MLIKLTLFIGYCLSKRGIFNIPSKFLLHPFKLYPNFELYKNMKTNHMLKATFCALLMFISFGKTLAQDLPKTLDLMINGESRKAVIYIPATANTKPTPVIFAFHGHGGTMLNMYRTRGFEKLWPEAIFICPQGLNTKGMLTDPEGKKSGWVMNDVTDSNRDLQFFDAMLKTLRTDYKIDNSRIYATGHSNGGGFVYLLWATRASEFAAFAPTATAAGTTGKASARNTRPRRRRPRRTTRRPGQWSPSGD